MTSLKKILTLSFMATSLLQLTACETTINSSDYTSETEIDIENEDTNPISSNEITEYIENTDSSQISIFTPYTIETSDGKYLACYDGQLTIRDDSYQWFFDPSVRNEYTGAYKVTTSEDDDNKGRLLDISNAAYFDGNSVSTQYYTGYAAQYWNLIETTLDDETGYMFISAEEPSYILHNSINGFVITTIDNATADDLYKLYPATDSTFNTMESQNGVMFFLYEKRLLEVISAERLQKWLNDYEEAYFAYSDLENGAPFDKVYIFDTEENYYWAAYCGNGIIRFDTNAAYEEFSRMSEREEEDVSFGMLHELGHLFDDGMPWVFEAEAMTDIKLPYILMKTGFYCAPSEFDVSVVFNYENISDAYNTLSQSLADGYGPYEMAAKMCAVYDEIGYDVLEDVLQNFPDTTGKSKYEIFEIWLDMNTTYSGVNVRAMFSDTELKNIKDALDA